MNKEIDREWVRGRWREIASNNAFAYNPQYLNEGTVDALIAFAAQSERYSEIPCARCGGRCIEFTVPNNVWNTIIRREGRERDDEYICEGCYRKAVEDFVRSESLFIREAWIHAYTSLGCDRDNAEKMVKAEIDNWLTRQGQNNGM